MRAHSVSVASAFDVDGNDVNRESAQEIDDSGIDHVHSSTENAKLHRLRSEESFAIFATFTVVFL